MAMTVALVSTWTPSMIVAMSAADDFERSARRRTSSATTANPRPLSPARAASMAALRARRLVWSAMSLMRVKMAPISLTRSARARVRSLEAPMSTSAWVRLSRVEVDWVATSSTVSAMESEARASSSVVADASVTAALCSVVVAASSSDDADSSAAAVFTSALADRLWSTSAERYRVSRRAKRRAKMIATTDPTSTRITAVRRWLATGARTLDACCLTRMAQPRSSRLS